MFATNAKRPTFSLFICWILAASVHQQVFEPNSISKSDNLEIPDGFLNMPYPTCPISLGHIKKNLTYIFSYNGLTLKNVLVSIKFCFREILGQTVWTKIRLRPSKVFWGTREKSCLLSRSLGARP